MRHQLPVLLALLLTCYIEPTSCQGTDPCCRNTSVNVLCGTCLALVFCNMILVSELLFDLWFDYSPGSDSICKCGSGGLTTFDSKLTLIVMQSNQNNPSFEAKVALHVLFLPLQ